MEKKPIPLLLAAKTHLSRMKSNFKRKYPEIEDEVSTDLTLSPPRQSSSRKVKKKMPPAKPANMLPFFNDNDVISTTINLLDESWLVKSKQSPENILSQETEVSTELTLSLHPNKKPASLSGKNDVVSWSTTKKMRHSDEVSGVSTELTLAEENPWKIRKTLKGSDIGNLSRFLVGTLLVNDYILPFMSEEIKANIWGKDGYRFKVYDCDTNTQHQLVFKRLASSRSFVFNEKWISDFVRRRGLKIGDSVGFYWDSSRSRFNFSVLHRSHD